MSDEKQKTKGIREQDFLTEEEVCKILRISGSKLRKDRSLGRGIPFIKMGGTIRYMYKDVESYIEQCKQNPKDAG